MLQCNNVEKHCRIIAFQHYSIIQTANIGILILKCELVLYCCDSLYRNVDVYDLQNRLT